jgi:hypothetical protein
MDTALKCPACSAIHFKGELCTLDGTRLEHCSMYEATEGEDRPDNERMVAEILHELVNHMPLFDVFDEEEDTASATYANEPAMQTNDSDHELQILSRKTGLRKLNANELEYLDRNLNSNYKYVDPTFLNYISGIWILS